MYMGNSFIPKVFELSNSSVIVIGIKHGLFFFSLRLNSKASAILLPGLTRRLKRAIGQKPQTLCTTAARRHPRHVCANLLQIRRGSIIKRILEAHLGGDKLIVESGLRQCLGRRHIATKHMNDILDRRRNNARATGGTDGNVQGVCDVCEIEVLDDDGGD